MRLNQEEGARNVVFGWRKRSVEALGERYLTHNLGYQCLRVKAELLTPDSPTTSLHVIGVD